MSDDEHVAYEQPFDSVIADYAKLEGQAASGIYVLPVVFVILMGLPLVVEFVAFSGAPAPFWLIPLPMIAVFGGVSFYLFRKLQRYRLAQAALQVWGQSHGFTAQRGAYVGVVAGRRCAAFALYRRSGRTEYAFDGFGLLVQLTTYSCRGLHLHQKPRTPQQAIGSIEAGFTSLLD